MMKLLRKICSAAALLASFVVTAAANAALTVTPAGAAAGFSLSTFYSDPAVAYGVLSLANGPDGFLYAAGSARGQVYKFNDVDGQTFGSQVLTAPAGGTPAGIATAGGQLYLNDLLQGSLYRVGTNLSLTPISVVPGLSFSAGLWGNPVNGHLIASSSGVLVDINPANGGWTFVDVHVPNLVIVGGLFNGDFVVKNNDGTVGVVNHLTGIQTIIAVGGAREDFVSPDLSNGTLFVAQNEGVLRLSCGAGCSIGTAVAAVPEAATYALMLAGLAILALVVRRRTRTALLVQMSGR
jgi:hypothetical protein